MVEKLILVDDEPEIREILGELLTDEGFDVTLAEDGKAALESFLRDDFDLVISDVRMPNKTGIELLKDIQQGPKSVDVIILTGQSDESTAIDCLRAGAYDYLLKPIEDLDILLSSVNRALEKRRLQTKNAMLVQQLEELAVRDPLTGLYNMRPFYQFVDSEITQASQDSSEFGLLFIDIDHFKTINDSFGHQFGDFVLKQFAHLLQQDLMETNKFFRYGGEEFVIMLPNINRDKCKDIALRLINIVRNYTFELGQESTSITISIGGAIYPIDSLDQVELIKLADQALYRAKSEGRDCYISANDAQVYR
ncbi:diguanylate cyclase [Vibrio ulleungensis]|uniref:diguanylate cyclase n=1 Tax=Vibrio ulleungensis TaxID=2807619 RepID=A0ABS2HIV5_9VIBR|nr:diguanylate cyclase [Vibrio ulleungensis]MBM7035999.1 diguanylate cyclase [Vibrio ulleungensis]